MSETTIIDTETDNRVIPIKPLEKKLSNRKMKALQNARDKKKKKEISRKLKKEVIPPKVEKIVEEFVESIPVEELYNPMEKHFERFDIEFNTPASEQMITDRNKQDSVSSTQLAKSKVEEFVATPQNLKRIENEGVKKEPANEPLKIYNRSVNTSQGIIFV